MTMLSKAIALARNNPVKCLPQMAAILVTKDGEEYVGYNSRKTHPLARKFGRNTSSVCLHAEIDAIRKGLRSEDGLSNSKMYVARVFKDGRPALAKPCGGCQRAIIAFGISEVEWTG